ncbi:MAG TPA: hypothetical protein VIM07_07220 [Chitinophagaceae bacterium]
MQKHCFLLLIIFLYSCSSTNVSVKNNLQPNGKKIGIGTIKITAQKSKHNTDTVCICTAQSTEKAFIPYLQQAGFSVIDLPINDRTNNREIMRVADSAKVDYILTGVGIVQQQGKSTFMEQLTIQLQDMHTGEIVTSASFSGVATRPVKAAGKIGGQLIKKIK